MAFSENLRKLMEMHGESGYKLAKELCCSQSTVSNWLLGNNTPTRAMVKALAEHYGTTADDLLSGQDDNA